MILTRKQRAVLRLAREGIGPTAISRETGLNRVTVSRLLSRARKNLIRAGLNYEKVMGDKDIDLLELVV